MRRWTYYGALSGLVICGMILIATICAAIGIAIYVVLTVGE